jgi:hypothetical protein
MKLKTILTLVSLLFVSISFCQEIKDASIIQILKDIYVSQKITNTNKLLEYPQVKNTVYEFNPDKYFYFDTDKLNKFLENIKTEHQNFNNFINTNWPFTILPLDLEKIFRDIMNISFEKERNYVVKKLKIIETCNLFSYFTARSVVNRSIPLDSMNYTISAVYLVKIAPPPNSNARMGTASFIDIPRIKSSEGSFKFVHEDGSVKGGWNYHMVPLFVVKDTQNANYFVVLDPFLYKKSVSFAQWIQRFDRNSDINIVRYSEDNSLNKRRTLNN